MAGKSRYTEEVKASVVVALAANDGNIKRTARETGLPENTVRRWKLDAAKNGPPPGVADAAGTFIESAVTIRDQALTQLQLKIPEAKPSELVAIVGMLDDKITRAKGLATGRVEHVHQLPSPEEIKALMTGFVSGVIDAQKQRQGELAEAEVRSKPLSALPSPR